MTSGEQHEAITAQVHHWLQQADLDPDEGVPLVLSLLDIQLETERLAQLSPPERKVRTFALLRHLVLHEAQRHPCILTVENLHWSDVPSEEWLTSLVERLAGAALLVLVTYRPGYQPPWLAQSYATQIALSRLRAEDSRTVVQAVLQTASVPEAVVQEIVTHAAGNPFFLEELAWHVIELRGGPPAPLAVPETIEAVLAARIDRLPPAEKRLLQTAAVIGMAVPVPLLQAVTDLATAELHTHLNHLQTAEFLYETGRLPASAYTFKHALTHEVAYGSLLQERRRVVHGRAAQAIEELFAERLSEHYYALAHHYSRSGHTAEAVNYLHRAGQQGLERSAYAEAVSHLTTALDLLATMPESHERAQQELDLQATLGPAVMAIKGYASREVAQAYARARELCLQVGETPQVFEVLLGLCTFYQERAELRTAHELAEQLLHLAQRLLDPISLLWAHNALGYTLHFMGEFVQARTHFEQSLALYNPHTPRAYGFVLGPGVDCLCALAQILLLLGYPDQALQRGQEALTLARELSHPFSLALALHCAARIHRQRGEQRSAQALEEASLALCREQGFAHGLAQGTALHGWDLVKQGQAEAGLTQMHQGLEGLRATGAEVERPWILTSLAMAYGNAGQPDEGLALLSEALDIVDKMGKNIDKSGLYRCKGELLLMQEGLGHKTKGARRELAAEAETYFHQALTIARQQEAKTLELRAAMSLIRLWQRQGKRIDAHQLLAEVYGWFTEGFDTADLRAAKALLDALA